jgi:Ca2+-binding EF-hand superfamily protein
MPLPTRAVIKADVQSKVTALVSASYSDDTERAFRAYDANSDAVISKDELVKLLDDAGVSFRMVSNDTIASAMIDEYDKDKTSTISWSELEAGLAAG